MFGLKARLIKTLPFHFNENMPAWSSKVLVKFVQNLAPYRSLCWARADKPEGADNFVVTASHHFWTPSISSFETSISTTPWRREDAVSSSDLGNEKIHTKLHLLLGKCFYLPSFEMRCLKTKLLDAGLSEGNLKISSLKPKTNVNLSLSKTLSWPSIVAISHKNHGLLLLNTLWRTNWRKVRTEISFNVTMHLCTQSSWNFATNRLRSGC